jgi:UDP-N-acetylmuramate--alanine ligase
MADSGAGGDPRSARAGGATGAAGAPWRGRRLHLVGVGGAGLSAYARAAHALGAEVTGSDASDTVYAHALARDGVLEPGIGHSADNVPAGDDVELIYSSAVPEENVERRAARERGLRERPRAELLAELTALRSTIAVAGTHGKTTTASMLVAALQGAGLDPGWLVGGSVGPGQPNARWGPGEWLVVEADESDRSMLFLQTEIAVLTNVEHDHHATFASLAALREAFAAFLANASDAIVVWDRPELLALARDAKATVAPYDLAGVELAAGGSTFPWRDVTVRLQVPGAHNALDAVAALEAARLAGADPGAAAGALAGFRGAARRFERLGESAGGALIYDDYAHHPTEVAATLAGARTLEPKRLVAVFQPHLFSRTAMLASELGRALAAADVAIVVDVYAARERAADHPGVSGLLVAESAADAAAGRPVYWLPTLDGAERVLGGLLRSGDVCVVMGAGDVETLGHRLVSR